MYIFHEGLCSNGKVWLFLLDCINNHSWGQCWLFLKPGRPHTNSSYLNGRQTSGLAELAVRQSIHVGGVLRRTFFPWNTHAGGSGIFLREPTSTQFSTRYPLIIAVCFSSLLLRTCMIDSPFFLFTQQILYQHTTYKYKLLLYIKLSISSSFYIQFRIIWEFLIFLSLYILAI